MDTQTLNQKMLEREDERLRLGAYIKGMKEAKIIHLDCNGKEYNQTKS